MKIYRLGLDEFKADPEASITIGSFDGVHLGHHSLLNKVLEGKRPTVATFDPHPAHVLMRKPGKIRILTPLEEKISLLESAGIERLVVIPFDEELAELTAERFLTEILIEKIGMKRLVVGFNHSFGKGKQGDIEFLRANADEYDYELVIVDPCRQGETTVSSTGIRKALLAGRIADANALLGREYRLHARVIRGDGRGQELGYPTANLEPVDATQVVPAEGVYAVRVIVEGEEYPGVGSVGRRSTFGDEGPVIVEVHIFDADPDLYGKKIKVDWIEYIRPQEKYKNSEELIAQMDRDSRRARELTG